MDYIDYCSFPMASSTDCSPTTEMFATSDTPLSLFDAYFSRPVPSTASGTFDTTSSAAPAPAPAPASATHYKSSPDLPFVQSPFTHLNDINPTLPFDTTSINDASALDTTISDASHCTSRTTSPPQNSSLASPPAPPSPQPQPNSEPTDPPLKLETSQEHPQPPLPKRKRGRPRLNRSPSSPSSLSTTTSSSTISRPHSHSYSQSQSHSHSHSHSQHTLPRPQRPKRLPHNQVERKYRENLNASLERLRACVPTLSHRYPNHSNHPNHPNHPNHLNDDAHSHLDALGGTRALGNGGGLGGLGNAVSGAVGQGKPSKATVLEAAIEYIGALEGERDALRGEVGRLRRINGSTGLGERGGGRGGGGTRWV